MPQHHEPATVLEPIDIGHDKTVPHPQHPPLVERDLYLFDDEAPTKLERRLPASLLTDINAGLMAYEPSSGEVERDRWPYVLSILCGIACGILALTVTILYVGR